MKPSRFLFRTGFAVAFPLLGLIAAATRAATPLHERIDQALAASKNEFTKQAAPPSCDAEFLRRIYLDLTGTIPTADEARAFLKDATPNKRQRLIDRLLNSPEHDRHMATVFDVYLMERRPDKHVPRAPWLEHLRTSFAANKPWDQLAREILSADGVDMAQRPQAKFLLDRDGDPNVLTRDVSRLFLGMNLQCAQCHDHPRIDDYKQSYYYGLLAFFNRTSVFADKTLKVSVLAEKADGEVTYQSVFDPAKQTKSATPRLLDLPAVAEPTFEKGQEYTVPPSPQGARPTPKFSRRAQLAAQITHADNAAFKRNAANRLWALLMGRGLVHPLDLDHSANPPSHPDLLNLLADDLAARKFDMRGFLRELALSAAYQRSSEAPVSMKEVHPADYLVANLKPLSPEQLAWSMMQASGLADAERNALGTTANEATLYAKLVGNVTPFVAAFAGQPAQAEAFDARLDQALFLANGPLVRGWLAPREGNLTDRLLKAASHSALCDELYLSVLTRLPSDEERKDVAEFLAKAKSRPAAIQELIGALLASAEFRFNH
jgi:hypothetical protein